jgi:AcrR family transcriptional regulator
MARPRDPEVDRKIIDAAAELLLRDGYAGLSLTAVAETAGVGKPALYRRYPTKAELVFAATVESSLKPDIPDTGNFAEDIRRSVAELVRTLKLAPRDILGEQIGRAMADPDFGMRMRKRHIDPSLVRMMRIWDGAVARNEVDATIDGARALRDLSSVVIMQVMLFGDQDDGHFQRELITRFLRSVAPR